MVGGARLRTQCRLVTVDAHNDWMSLARIVLHQPPRVYQRLSILTVGVPQLDLTK